MFCASCGERSGWWCGRCGRFGAQAWLVAVGAFTWSAAVVASALYTWRLLPTVEAVLAGLSVTVGPMTQWHAQIMSGWSGFALVLVAVALAFLSLRGSRSAAVGLALSGCAVVAFTLVGISSALLSMVVHAPFGMHEAAGQIDTSERGSLALLAGDGHQAVALFEALHRERIRPGGFSVRCMASAAYSTFQLAEAHRRAGDEAQAHEMYLSAEKLAGQGCSTVLDKQVKEMARQRMDAAPPQPTAPRP